MASIIDVATAAGKAGWATSPPDWQTAVAVGWATSGGDTLRTGGVWGLPGAPTSGADTQARLDAQAAHAYAAWRKDGWGPFPGHKGNGWLLYGPLAAAAISGAGAVNGGQAAAGAVTDLPNLALQALKLPERVLAWLTDPVSVVRIAKVLIGGAVIVGAVYLLAQVQVVAPAGEKAAAVLVGGKAKAAKVAAAKGTSS